MIKYIEINNFKSLVKFSTRLTGTTVLIGENASGKSSILQVIGFAFSSVREDFSIILERRGWSVENIKSKLVSSSKMRLLFEFELADEDNDKHRIQWEMILRLSSAKNEVYLSDERIVADDEESILEYRNNSYVIAVGDKNRENIGNISGDGFSLTSSVLKNVSNDDRIDYRLRLLINYILRSSSYEMLRPENMRTGELSKDNKIGISGAGIHSVVRQMSEIEKKQYMEMLKSIFGISISKMEVKKKGADGLLQIEVIENNGVKNIKFSSKELNDGFLLIMAFLVIRINTKTASTLLFDEIENGINQQYLERVYRFFVEMFSSDCIQTIISTHSTVMLDYVNPEDIIYVYREDDGSTKSIRFTEVPGVDKKLEYMYPGEIILNADINLLGSCGSRAE